MGFSVFQFEHLLFYRAAPTVLRLVGETPINSTSDTWASHVNGSDAYSTSYVSAIQNCNSLYVDFKNLSSLSVQDTANFVPNLTGLYLDDCTNITSLSLTHFPNLTSISIAGTSLRDDTLTQIPLTRRLVLVDASNTRNITHVPSALTVNVGHSLVTAIDASMSHPVRIVANDARITSLQVFSETTTLVWSYSGKTLTVSGAGSGLTILTPQASSDIFAGNAVIVPISYWPQ
jgi:hypothetical protein